MITELLILGVTLFLIFYGVKTFISSNNNFWPSRGVRLIHFKEVATFWEIFMRKKSMAQLDAGYYRAMGNDKFAGMMEFRNPVLYVNDLDILKCIIVKDFDHFVDRRNISFGNEAIFNNMLTTLHGQIWKEMRSVLSPAFATGKIRRMFQHFNNCGNKLVDYVKNSPQNSDGGHSIIVQEVAARYTVDVIGATAFGMETNALKEKDSPFYKHAKTLSEISFARTVKSFAYILFPKLAKLLNLKIFDQENILFFKGILSNALKTRESASEKESKARNDFLQLLIEARKGNLKSEETEQGSFEKAAELKQVEGSANKSKLVLDDDMAMAQSFLFFVAGFDTVGAVLGTAMYFLAVHTDIQEQLAAEVESATEASEGEIDYDSIGKMELLDRFVSELMRLYPAAGRLERACTKDYKIPDTDIIIPKGTLVAFSVDGIHKDERYYPNPQQFDMDRFSPEEKTKRHAYAYLPFGIGPRSCIAMRFALTEVKVAIAQLVRSFLIEPTEKTPIPIQIEQVMGSNRIVKNLELQFKFRESA